MPSLPQTMHATAIHADPRDPAVLVRPALTADALIDHLFHAPRDADRAAELELLGAIGVVRDLVTTYGGARVARWVRHLAVLDGQEG